MLNTPFSPWPSYSDEEIDAVVAVLRSNRVNYWTGDECRQFEREFAEWAGARHGIALSNGTVALDLALHGLCIGSANGGSPSDEVIVTPRTFIASASCVVNAGAVPVFADVDRDSGNITAETIACAISPKTKAIIPVHLGGWPCDMDPIMDLAKLHGLKVIEDCAQAHGAHYKGRSVGTIGDVGAWSFCQDKIMTTGGEGGLVTCEDEQLWSRMWSFKDHGKSWAAVYERNHRNGFRWLHESIGTNWRMVEMQGAIGRVQLRRMAEWTSAREANARALTDAIAPFAVSGGPVRIPCLDDAPDKYGTNSLQARYRLYAYVRPDQLALGWDRDRIVEEVNRRGVPAFHGSCSEVYLEKAFEGSNWIPKERLAVAQELGETSLMFLTHPTLTPDQIRKSQAVLTEVLEAAAK